MEAQVRQLDFGHDSKMASPSGTTSGSEAEGRSDQRSTRYASVQQCSDDAQQAGMDCAQTDLRRAADTFDPQSLEDVALTMQRALAENRVNQQQWIAEAVACPTAAAMVDVMAQLSDVRVDMMAQVSDVRVDMKHHAACPQSLAGPHANSDQLQPGLAEKGETKPDDIKATSYSVSVNSCGIVLPEGAPMHQAAHTTSPEIAHTLGDLCMCGQMR